MTILTPTRMNSKIQILVRFHKYAQGDSVTRLNAADTRIELLTRSDEKLLNGLTTNK